MLDGAVHAITLGLAFNSLVHLALGFSALQESFNCFPSLRDQIPPDSNHNHNSSPLATDFDAKNSKKNDNFVSNPSKNETRVMVMVAVRRDLIPQRWKKINA